VGGEADGNRKLQPLAGHLAQFNWRNFSAYIAKTYDIADEAAIWFLIEQLDGVVMRDQRPSPPQFAGPNEQRKAAHAAAEEIRLQARLVELGLRNLEKALTDFDSAVGESFWSAAMLEEVFDVPYVDPNAIEPPEIFDPLRGFSIEHAKALAEIRGGLSALSALPVRPRRRTNKVRDHVLRQALKACRTFWEDGLGRSWSRSSLTHLGPAGSAQIDQLSGECERFVVDMLTAAEVRFKLKTLNGAWSAFDKDYPKS
jgi:hypothetical protein